MKAFEGVSGLTSRGFSHLRFSLKQKVVAVTAFSLMFVIFVRPRPSGWVGETRLRIRFQLVDSVTGTAVPNADVMMSHPLSGNFSSRSDANGIADIVIPCMIGASDGVSDEMAQDCLFRLEDRSDGRRGSDSRPRSFLVYRRFYVS